jgi:hypothetical protein
MNNWAAEEKAKIFAQLQEKTEKCGSVDAKSPNTEVVVEPVQQCKFPVTMEVVEHITLDEAMVEMKTDREVSTQSVEETAGEVSIQLGENTSDAVGPETPQKAAGVQDILVENISVGNIFIKQSPLGADNTRHGGIMDMLPIDITGVPSGVPGVVSSEVPVVPAQAVPVVPAQAIPVVSAQAVPVVSAQAVPVVPAQAVPVAPTDNFKDHEVMQSRSHAVKKPCSQEAMQSRSHAVKKT